MKQWFWLFKRCLVFYLQDSETGKKDSLGTRDPKQAERLRAVKNEAAEKPLLGLTLGKAYLSAYDPKLVERKWAQVMDEFGQRGRDSSRARYARALKSPALAALRDKKIVDTTPDDFRAALARAWGYPERWAQNALGHNSRAVHEAYAKSARPWSNTSGKPFRFRPRRSRQGKRVGSFRRTHPFRTRQRSFCRAARRQPPHKDRRTT